MPRRHIRPIFVAGERFPSFDAHAGSRHPPSAMLGDLLIRAPVEILPRIGDA